MTAQRLDGKVAAAAIKSELAARVAALRDRGVVPGLATVLVGEDPASQNYVRMKHRDCEEVGIASLRVDLPADADAATLQDRRLGVDVALQSVGSSGTGSHAATLPARVVQVGEKPRRR